LQLKSAVHGGETAAQLLPTKIASPALRETPIKSLAARRITTEDTVMDDYIDQSIDDNGAARTPDAWSPGAEPDAAEYADEYAFNDIGLALRLQSERP
jgi:hypothetical protein